MSFLFIVVLWLALSGISISANAQHQTDPSLIKGSVVDDFGHPLENVYVSIKGQSDSVKTDENGNFTISANRDNKLVFHSSRFYTKELAVRGRDSVVVRLDELYLQRPKGVNTLYNVQPGNEILGSVSTAYTNQLTTTPAAQYSFAMTGRLPGLYTKQTTGWPTPGSLSDNTQMQLALRGHTPITIVDGVQRDIYSIPPENIESVSVFKDALSTILLGQLSSNGVVLVTTKRPQAGTPRISFTAQTGVQTPPKLQQPLPAYQYAWLYNEALQNDGLQPAYGPQDILAYQDHSDPLGHPDVNWYNNILRDDAPQSRYDLSISGGNEVASYIASVGYMDRQGLFVEQRDIPYNTNASLDRYTVSTHVDVNANRNLTVSLDIFGRIEDSNQPGAGTDAIIKTLFTTPNNAYSLFNPDGSLGGNSVFKENLYGLATSSGYITGTERDVMANIDLKYRFDDWVPGLWLKVKGNVSSSSFSKITRSLTQPVFQMGQNPQTGDTIYHQSGKSVPQSNSFSYGNHARYWYGQFALGYDRQFGKNHISTMLFGDQRQATVNYEIPAKYTNVAAQVSFNRQSKYFAEAAINYSGYDRYRPGIQFGLFYAGGLGWDMAQENFIKKNLHWIDLLKWRITYGLTGNANVGYFIYKTYYTSGAGYDFGANPSVTGSGGSESALPNPDATWEKAHKLNIGLDVELFDDHFQLTAEYYRNRYFDLMQVRGKNTAIIGSHYPDENIGVNRYSGIELSLTYTHHFGDFDWFVTANASRTQAIRLYSDEQKEQYAWNKITGRPLNLIKGYIAEGLYQTEKEANNSPHIVGYLPQSGDIKYKDLNGDGVIDHYDKAPIGNKKPLIYYGVTLGFSFKGFDCSVLLQGVQNTDLLLKGDGVWTFNNSAQGEAFGQAMERWTPETAGTATLPRVTAGNNPNNTLVSSYWIRSGDYLRVKNIEIGYNLPYRWTHWLRLGSVRFFANGLNLFTHAVYDRIDPEVSSETAAAGVYPIQKVTNVGVNIKF